MSSSPPEASIKPPQDEHEPYLSRCFCLIMRSCCCCMRRTLKGFVAERGSKLMKRFRAVVNSVSLVLTIGSWLRVDTVTVVVFCLKFVELVMGSWFMNYDFGWEAESKTPLSSWDKLEIPLKLHLKSQRRKDPSLEPETRISGLVGLITRSSEDLCIILNPVDIKNRIIELELEKFITHRIPFSKLLITCSKGESIRCIIKMDDCLCRFSFGMKHGLRLGHNQVGTGQSWKIVA
ncbi:unnamed protein product [Vicia faba]|uniref:Uncharacterized protein n=1 Tax=Vicia faba TaxID=3906 RepID=A0AAV1AIT7_VICFA|nr:unnamed protein product [Vicia faba]